MATQTDPFADPIIRRAYTDFQRAVSRGQKDQTAWLGAPFLLPWILASTPTPGKDFFGPGKHLHVTPGCLGSCRDARASVFPVPKPVPCADSPGDGTAVPVDWTTSIRCK